MKRTLFSQIGLFIGAFLLMTGNAAAGVLDGRLNGGNFTGYSVVALSPQGDVVGRTTVNARNRFHITTASANFSLQFVDSSSRYAGPGVVVCESAARSLGCSLGGSNVGVGFTGRVSRGDLVFNRASSGYFKATVTSRDQLKRIKTNMTARAVRGRPSGNATNLGLSKGSGSIANTANPTDRNKDSVPDSFSIDDDGDGIIDNYDRHSDSPATLQVSSPTASNVRVFSNLKLDIERSLNVNTGTTPTTAEIDAALSSAGTLAIAVVGDAGAGDTTELDCGALGYCTTGGTGSHSNLAFPDFFDGDSDGFGTVTAGGTGDFQLTHGANSADIAAGDSFFEIVTEPDTTTTNVPGMLNFVFNTTPALKTLAVQSGSTYTVSYPAASGMQGSNGNCFPVPASGDVILTVTAWRAQRPGNLGIGESAYMDIGQSLFTIDIPNAPCTGSGGCSGSGPGNCAVASYLTTDPNLSVGTDGLNDSFTDSAADTSNTLSFTVNVTQCLGATSFNSGEKLFIDLQSRSSYSDNAAQKFCIQRS